MEKTKVAFLCVHNSCRSQIAESLMRKYGSDIVDVYSAGTLLKDSINSDAIRLMKSIYNIDMSIDQRPKLIFEIPSVDYIITMGCNVSCPVLDYDYISEDWGLDDPSGKSDYEFKKVIDEIDFKVKDLINRLKN